MNFNKKNLRSIVFLAIGILCFSVFINAENFSNFYFAKSRNVVNNQSCCDPVPISESVDTVKLGCVFKTVFEQEYSDSDFLMATPEKSKLAIAKGLKFLLKEQLQDGSWEGSFGRSMQGQNSNSKVGDPATTSLVAMSLLNCGANPYSGDMMTALNNATKYLVLSVETCAESDANITKVTNTQAQIKLGKNIDAMLTSQYFTNLLGYYANDTSMKSKLTNCIKKCVRKIEKNQSVNGSFNGGGWAGVLQSSIANNALESAIKNGISVDSSVLQKSRDYQKSNFDVNSKNVKVNDGAGIMLYSLSSTGRGAAQEAVEAKDIIKKANKSGKIKNTEVTKANLKSAGLSEDEAVKYETAYQINTSASKMAQREDIMVGFGNNGGEEFYSFLQTGEGLIIGKNNEWKQWYTNVSGKLISIQGENGNWQGHHCITSPVFCTATCLLILSITDNAANLIAMK